MLYLLAVSAFLIFFFNILYSLQLIFFVIVCCHLPLRM